MSPESLQLSVAKLSEEASKSVMEMPFQSQLKSVFVASYTTSVVPSSSLASSFLNVYAL